MEGDDSKPEYEIKVQLSFNFTHAERLGKIQRAVLPKVNGCSPASLKSVLGYLNTFQPGKCYPGITKISEATQLSERQVKRVIKALELISILCWQKRKSLDGIVCSHYAIVWSELELLGQPRPTSPEKSELATRRPATRPAAETNPSFSDADHTSASATSVERSATSVERSATSVERSATSVERSATSVERSATSVERSATSSSYKYLTIKEQETNIHHLHHPFEAQAQTWERVVVELMSLGIGSYRKVIECAQSRGLTESAFLAQLQIARAVIDLPANAKRFRDPICSMIYYLREGCWPASGVVTPSIQAHHDQLDAAARDRERMRLRLFSIIRGCRAKKVDDAEIKRRLRIEIPDEFCRQQGW